MQSEREIYYNTPPQPRQLRLDTTTRCQATCLSCHRFMTKRSGEMPVSLITQILTDVSKWKIPLEEIIPVNYGELFLRKDWAWILEMIAQKLPNTRLVIPTNGAMFDEAVVLKLASIPNLHIINFSINAFFAETYKRFTGLPPDTITKIRKAIAQLRVLRPDIGLRVSMVSEPEYSTDLERDLFRAYWISIAQPWVIHAASAGRKDGKTEVKLPCRSIFSDIVVGFDGKISSCCFDADFSAYDFGMYSGKLLDNWHGKELTQFRRIHSEHRRQEISLCSRCSYA